MIAANAPGVLAFDQKRPSVSGTTTPANTTSNARTSRMPGSGLTIARKIAKATTGMAMIRLMISSLRSEITLAASVLSTAFPSDSLRRAIGMRMFL